MVGVSSVVVVVAVALAPAHDSAESASISEDQPVNLLDDVAWAQRLRFPFPNRTAAYIAGCHRAHEMLRCWLDS